MARTRKHDRDAKRQKSSRRLLAVQAHGESVKSAVSIVDYANSIFDQSQQAAPNESVSDSHEQRNFLADLAALEQAELEQAELEQAELPTAEPATGSPPGPCLGSLGLSNATCSPCSWAMRPC